MEIPPEKLEIYRSLYGLYKDLNDKVNLISRKDFENFYLHHIIHSLSITKFELIKDENNIIDLGTGGGLPGIPLAIYYNKKNFLLALKKLNLLNSKEIYHLVFLINNLSSHLRKFRY